MKEFGARGDGETDDAPAINRAIASMRDARQNGAEIVARLVFPQGKYLIRSTVNLTGLQSRNVEVDGPGAVVYAATSGKPAIDALGTRFLRIRDLSIEGAEGSEAPSIGLQIGRTEETRVSTADNVLLSSVYITGQFSFAAIYNFATETSKFDRVNVWNSAPGPQSYALVQDGMNHWNAHSEFVAEHAPTDKPQSFNENLFVNADIRHSGGGTPIWMANTGRHQYEDSYVASVHNPHAVELFSSSATDQNRLLNFDTHVETTAVVDALFLTGPNPTPILPGLRLRDHASFATRSLLGTDNNVTRATLIGANIEVGEFASPTARVFAKPDLWSGSVDVTVPALRDWNGTSAFSAIVTAGDVKSLQVPFPDPLDVNNIKASGAVTEIVIAAPGAYVGATVPGVRIAPPATGTRASAQVTAMGLYSVDRKNVSEAGHGYAKGDVLTLIGGACSVPPTVRVTDTGPGGEITELAGNSEGKCENLSASYSLTGGHGTGAAIKDPGMGVLSIAVRSGGSGYTAAPTVTFINARGSPGATATAMILDALTLASGNSSAVLSPSGIALTGGVSADRLRITPGHPVSSRAPCTPGEIRTDSNYVYVCTATDTWKRSALADW